MGLSQIDDEDLDNERKSIEKLFKYSDIHLIALFLIQGLVRGKLML